MKTIFATKTVFATLGALALATTAAYAEGGDGGKDQREFYAVVRGDYSLTAAEAIPARSVSIAETALRSETQLRPEEVRQIEFESPNR